MLTCKYYFDKITPTWRRGVLFMKKNVKHKKHNLFLKLGLTIVTSVMTLFLTSSKANEDASLKEDNSYKYIELQQEDVMVEALKSYSKKTSIFNDNSNFGTIKV